MTKEFAFGGLSNSRARAKTPADRCYSSQNCTVERGIIESGPRYLMFGAHADYNAADACYGMGYGSYANDEIQKLQVTGTPTSGTVVLTFNGVAGGALAQDTGAIAYSATAATVQTALEALAGLRIGDVACTGGPWPNEPIYVKFKQQYSHTDMASLVLKTNGLGGGTSPTLAITEYVAGGTTSVYLVAIKKSGDSTVTMFKVDTAGVYTSVATGLTASNWFFQQYGNAIYCSNETDGVHTFRIGGSWDDAASGTRPKPPAYLPTLSYLNTGSFIDFSTGFASVAQTGLSAATITLTSKFIDLKYTGASIATATEVVVTGTLSAAADHQFNDIWDALVLSPGSASVQIVPKSVRLTLINDDGSPVTITPPYILSPEGSNSVTQGETYSQFAGYDRTLRDNILKYVITFKVSSWAANTTVVISLLKGLSWMADTLPLTFTTGNNIEPDGYQFHGIKYMVSYYDAGTGLESELRPTIPGWSRGVPGTWQGANITLSIRGSSELTTNDRIYVYRMERATGELRRLPTDANNLGTFGAANVTSGLTTYTDKWMEAELKDFPSVSTTQFSQSSLEGAGPVMTDWKQSLVVGAERKLWLSFVGAPLVFAPDVEDKDASSTFILENKDNPDRGRTVFMSDNRAESVYNVHGQDTLYAVGPLSSYAMVGDTPASASPPRRLPGSRGSVSQRASCRFGGGIEVGSQDGLWYYSVGRGFSGEDNGALVEREETAEVRRSWATTLLGSSYANLPIVEFNDQLWAFNGTKYLMRNRDLQWQEGTFADSVYALIGIRSVGLRFADSKGRLHTINTAYTDDNGTAALWSYSTGLLDGPPVKIDGFEMQYSGTPRVTVRVYRKDGDKSDSDGRYFEYHFDTPGDQLPYRIPCTVSAGLRHALVFSGTCGLDTVQALTINFEQSGKQYGG